MAETHGLEMGDERPESVVQGLGEERPSIAETGVLATVVGAVDCIALIGVKGDARGNGELSSHCADFGGTSGGLLLDLIFFTEP